MIAAVLFFVLALAPAGPPLGIPATEFDALAVDLDTLFDELDVVEPARFPALIEELVALAADGQPVAAHCLEGFGELGFIARRSRARLLEQLADPASIPTALELLGDTDPEVRASLAGFLGQLSLADHQSRQRVGALVRLAGYDPEKTVRAAALSGLAQANLAGTARALDELLDSVDIGAAPAVARVLADLPSARVRLVRRVRAAFESAGSGQRARGLDGAVLPEERVLGILLAGYGRALAELPAGGREAAERVPLVLGSSHPSDVVRAAAQRARDRCFQRLFDLAEHERALRLVRDLGDDGLPRHLLFYRGAKIALLGLGDAARAAEFARALITASELASVDRRSEFRFYGLHFSGVALFAQGGEEDLREAGEYFLRATAVLRGLLQKRPDLRGPESSRGSERLRNRVGGRSMVEHLHLLALEQFWQALSFLAHREDTQEGLERFIASPAAAPLFEWAHSAHLALLEAAAIGIRADTRTDSSGFDVILDRDLAPGALVLFNRKLADWSEHRSTELFHALGRVCATVMPWEFPGFEPVPGVERRLTDPLFDVERLALLKRIRSERYYAAHRKLTELGESGALDAGEEASQTLWRSLQIQLRVIGEEQQREQEALTRLVWTQALQPSSEELRTVYASLARLQFPSLFGLSLAVQMRADGNSGGARELGQNILAHLERGLPGSTDVWTEWASARVEDLIGATYMDEELPYEAERSCLSAVRRLEAIENSMLGWGGNPDRIRLLRGNVLLALAVNANVRMDDQERALGYFERAFELDQRDFMQILRACYRARSGRIEEARGVLRAVTPTPQLYYNLACTYALLGDVDTALDYLQREFEENHPTEGSRQRQRVWASKDPDLISLRENERFLRLVR